MRLCARSRSAAGPGCGTTVSSKPGFQRLSTPRARKKDASDQSDEALASGIADLARQALSSDPEAAKQLQRYEAAVVALEKARAKEKELEKMMAEAAKQAQVDEAAAAQEARARADQIMADAEVAAAEKLLRAAEIRNAMAQQELSSMSKDADRSESAKAGAIAAAGGALGALPFVLGAGQAGLPVALSLAASVASSLLFGVTYRYAVREDVGNTQLKLGVVAAFGLAKAIGGADVMQAAAGGALDAMLVATAAVYAAQSVLTFAFAATAVEAAFGAGALQRMRR